MSAHRPLAFLSQPDLVAHAQLAIGEDDGVGTVVELTFDAVRVRAASMPAPSASSAWRAVRDRASCEGLRPASPATSAHGS